MGIRSVLCFCTGESQDIVVKVSTEIDHDGLDLLAAPPPLTV